MTRRAKPINLNPVAHAIEGAAKLPTAQVTSVQHAMLQTLADFRSGQRCAHAWPVMVDALNIAENLSQLGIASDDDSRQRITAGMDVLANVLDRHTTRGSWTLYPAELTALDDAIWTHNVQMAHCSRLEYDKAVQMTQRRAEQALAGNAGAGVRVLHGALT